MKKDWKNINLHFTNRLQQEWEAKGFTYEQTKEWIDIGLKPQESCLAYYCQIVKKITPEWVLNYGDLEALKNEFKVWASQSPKTTQSIAKPPSKPTLPSHLLMFFLAILGLVIICLNFSKNTPTSLSGG